MLQKIHSQPRIKSNEIHLDKAIWHLPFQWRQQKPYSNQLEEILSESIGAHSWYKLFQEQPPRGQDIILHRRNVNGDWSFPIVLETTTDSRFLSGSVALACNPEGMRCYNNIPMHMLFVE